MCIGTNAQPSSPVLTEPPNLQTSVSLTPTFTWQAVSGASIYQLWVYTDIIGPANIEPLTANTYYTLEDQALNPDATYYWKVRAGDGDVWGSWSGFRTVST